MPLLPPKTTHINQKEPACDGMTLYNEIYHYLDFVARNCGFTGYARPDENDITYEGELDTHDVPTHEHINEEITPNDFRSLLHNMIANQPDEWSQTHTDEQTNGIMTIPELTPQDILKRTEYVAARDARNPLERARKTESALIPVQKLFRRHADRFIGMMHHRVIGEQTTWALGFMLQGAMGKKYDMEKSVRDNTYAYCVEHNYSTSFATSHKIKKDRQRKHMPSPFSNFNPG